MTQFVEKEGDLIQVGFELSSDLYSGKSDFQEIRVVETKAYGRMLVLDGAVMLTDTDEFVYHEMISHIPVCYHKDPRKVIVIGGGDGGTVRELLKYPSIEEIILCEIDQLVIDVSEKYFPKIAGKLRDDRVTVKVGDGIEYIKSLENFADIIIIDSTDPIGPGEGLFTANFYKSVARALKKDGIMVAQTESPWHEAKILEKIKNNIQGGFKEVHPYIGSIPTYPRGLWSWTLGSQHHIKDQFNKERFNLVKDELEYLTPVTAQNIFQIPPFYRRKLGL